MKESTKEKLSSSDVALDECCSIAESMMQEIQIIKLVESRLDKSADNSRRKGSLKKKLMRQIELAKRMSMTG